MTYNTSVRTSCNSTALLPITAKVGASVLSKGDLCQHEKEGKPRSEVKIKTQES